MWPSRFPPVAARATSSWPWKKPVSEVCSPWRCWAMTVAKFYARDWQISLSLCNATTYRASRKYRLRFTTSCAKLWRFSTVAKFELFGAARCPHTQEMRDWLEFRRCDFVEYDVEADPVARQRMSMLEGGQRNVPL